MQNENQPKMRIIIICPTIKPKNHQNERIILCIIYILKVGRRKNQRY